MAVPLQKTLQMLGYDGDADQFRDALAELHAALHPSWTVDELLCHPDLAMSYCDVVRRRTGNFNLTDPFILRALLSLRKQRQDGAS